MTDRNTKRTTSLVPLPVTIGLGVFAFVLSTAGFLVRLMVEADGSAVLWHALKFVPIFMLLIPSAMCAGAYAMNRFGGANIAMRNAWTLGWLLSCVGLLTIIGRYS